jgi:hypothetical protein
MIYRLIAEGKFPAPIRIGPRRVVWLTDEIEAFLDARRAERDANPDARSPSYVVSLGSSRAERR